MYWHNRLITGSVKVIVQFETEENRQNMIISHMDRSEVN